MAMGPEGCWRRRPSPTLKATGAVHIRSPEAQDQGRHIRAAVQASHRAGLSNRNHTMRVNEKHPRAVRTASSLAAPPARIL